ncbi:hypothetical protein PR202_gb02836 [Eleusine coracana subsp. coracana]|uniref:Uncharacterized protein n=1 Tax=Eleusine coracana subsp. coracana TaxID=191504 RepID=A0AAV5E097_ELECO|nr:hypothetical protein QOZ80_8BG0664070 [Eleusine coracana subsp. coracana]GJN15891.1 hypothetical protein PR202_gb02836 [Eleusine coracana subsp. coracana]
MESSTSHITGDDGEGCNSSESGWTMYLASPIDGDDGSGSGKGSGSEGSSVDDGYGYINGRRRSGKAYDDYADDDSLASDASTGPAKVKAPSSLPERGKGEDEGHGRNRDGGGGYGGADEDDDGGDEEDGGRTRFSNGSRKKSGKVDKGGGGGEGKSSRRGHSKKGTSSRRSFFFW